MYFKNYIYSSLFLLFLNNFEAKQKNVILIMFDDLRPTIGAYGDKLALTPNIDKLIQKSFYFTKAYSQQALCAPSRNSMLTSRRPDTLHLYDFYSYWRNFAGNFTTLPQYFKENGYLTNSIGKIFHPGISSNFTDDYPFSWSIKSFHPKTEAFINSPVCPNYTDNKYYRNLLCPVKIKDQPLHTLPDIESLVEAKFFLKTSKKFTKPFFLGVGFHKPHVPFKFPEYFLKLFKANNFNYSNIDFKTKDMPNVAWNPYTDLRHRNDVKNLNISFPFGPMPESFGILIRQHYYASVAYVDFLFGQLLNSINFNNTIIIVTSDHGWSLGEHSEWSKYSNFDVAIRVPLIIYSPEYQQFKTKKIKNIVELIDLFPTIVDLANLPKVPSCRNQKTLKFCTEGKSLIEMMRNFKDQKLYLAFSQYPRPGPYLTLYPNSDKPKLKDIHIMGYSVRSKNFRYTLWIQFNSRNFTKDWNKSYGEELYYYKFKPEESQNLINLTKFKRQKLYLKRRLIEQFS